MNRNEIETEARKVLLTNRCQGVAEWSGIPYDFVCPAVKDYPFQWFWDSCFHAIALIHIDAEQAKSEMRTLMSAALPDGFIPHLIFWEMEKQSEFLAHNIVGRTSEFYSATIQPPIIAYAVERIYDATGDDEFRRESIPILTTYYRWLSRVRDPDEDGLIAVIQPEETGIDCSPKYDEVLGLKDLSNRGFITALKSVYEKYEPLRGDDRQILAADIFHVEDVLVNSVYALGLRSLARLLGDVPEATHFHMESDRVRDALLSKCWDEELGIFFDLSGVDETPIKVVTISSLMPLIFEDLPSVIVERLVRDWITRPEHFWTQYPLPSVPVSDPKFLPGNTDGFIWRGPTWVNTNWLLVHALRNHGYNEIADTIVDRNLECVEKSGFREYYNPQTGQGLGARNFGWSTLVLDL